MLSICDIGCLTLKICCSFAVLCFISQKVFKTHREQLKHLIQNKVDHIFLTVMYNMSDFFFTSQAPFNHYDIMMYKMIQDVLGIPQMGGTRCRRGHIPSNGGGGLGFHLSFMQLF